MRMFFGVLVLAWSCIVPQVVRAAEAPAQDSGEVETLKRLGQQMGDAMIARDINALDFPETRFARKSFDQRFGGCRQI